MCQAKSKAEMFRDRYKLFDCLREFYDAIGKYWMGSRKNE